MAYFFTPGFQLENGSLHSTLLQAAWPINLASLAAF